MTKHQLANHMDKLFDKLKALRIAGQQEYARQEGNAFANFARVAERTKISQEKCLLVYLEKHLDGIHAYTDGHRSQRESVHGRIQDALVYLCILDAIITEEEDKQSVASSNNAAYPPLGNPIMAAGIATS